MKKYILLFTIILNSYISNSQSVHTLNISPNGTNSINVNIEVVTSTLSNFINQTYSIDNNIITMEICYFLTGQQVPILYTETYPVTVPSDNNYTIIINLYRSQTQNTCDYTELTDTESMQFTTPLTETIYLGVEDFELLDNQISIYPNPVKDIVNINNPNNIIFNSIVMYNILGEKIKIYTNSFESLDLRNLNSGMYFLELNTDKGNITKKIIVSN